MCSLREYLADVEIHIEQKCRPRFGGLEALSGLRVVHTPVSWVPCDRHHQFGTKKATGLLCSDMLQVPHAVGPDMLLLVQVGGTSFRHSAADSHV